MSPLVIFESRPDVPFRQGATVLHALTEKVAGANDSARLVMKIGGEIEFVVTVMEAVKEDRVQIEFSPDKSAQEAIDLIYAG